MTKQLQDAYIVAATRTPIGKAPRGMFKNVRPDDLLVRAIQSAVSQVPGLDVKLIEDAIVGCSFPEAEQGLNVARMAVLLAGLPKTVAGVTINRYCASGITAVAMAADRIRVGQADVMIAAGAESMSMVPMMGISPVGEHGHFQGREHRHGLWHGPDRRERGQAMEDFARGTGRILAQVAPEGDCGTARGRIQGRDDVGRSPRALPQSRHGENRPQDPQREPGRRRACRHQPGRLAKLRPVFAPKGSVTAGNSSQTSDGAGALILVSEKILKQFNLTPLARFVSFAVRGVPPEIMGIGPKEAIPVACKAAGITQDQIDWFELNEAFAAQSLAVIQDLISIRPR